MAQSSTVVIALKFDGGVVLAADSQASEPVGGVRWEVEKLEAINNLPVVVVFSGNTGIAGKAREALQDRLKRPTQVEKIVRIRGNLEDSLRPVYDEIKRSNQYVTQFTRGMWEINLWGLIGCWSEGGPHIIEHELSADSDTHEWFHAIGSGTNTAYAI